MSVGAPRVPDVAQNQSSTGPQGAGARDDVVVRRSARRRRTVTAFREQGKTVVVIPDSLSREEEDGWVRLMLARMEANERRGSSDEDLAARAAALSQRYFGGKARPSSVRWVTNQNSRWGSCTPADRSIRLSHRLQGMPDWVVDGVLVHELAHLFEPGHGPRFQALMAVYPDAERAKGFLDGVAHGWNRPLEEGAVTPVAGAGAGRRSAGGRGQAPRGAGRAPGSATTPGDVLF